eukprot:Lithocolla_globosa_v1_NODE_2075_length_2178_cov_19.803109.p2 type:complete len:128 gc:universal NODE_2075_length_2178_cov_19.803109:1609-1992(+)
MKRLLFGVTAVEEVVFGLAFCFAPTTLIPELDGNSVGVWMARQFGISCISQSLLATAAFLTSSSDTKKVIGNVLCLNHVAFTGFLGATFAGMFGGNYDVGPPFVLHGLLATGFLYKIMTTTKTEKSQ